MQRVRRDWATELNWVYAKAIIFMENTYISSSPKDKIKLNGFKWLQQELTCFYQADTAQVTREGVFSLRGL